MAEQILLFHAFLIYKEITRKQQTENSFNKTLEGKKKKKKERQVENSSYTWMNCQRSKSFMYVKGGLAFRELSPN